MNWPEIRAEFPALKRWTYLNTSAFGQMPKRTTQAAVDHWQHRDELACSDFLDWYEDMNRIRAAVARLIHASPEDIAFVPNAATALAYTVNGLGLKSGDNVLTLADEYPNYHYVDRVKAVPWDKFLNSIDRNTRLLALSEVNYCTGFRPPLEEICAAAKDRRVPLFIDGSQSVGALQFDITKTPVDVLAVHAYKWMISPSGAGFMYVSPAMRERMEPTIVGWRSHGDWRNVDNLHHGKPQFKSTAEKYEGGGLPFSLLYPLEASVNWLLEIGPDKIEQRVLQLASQVREAMLELGAATQDDVADPSNPSQIVTAYWPFRDSSELVKRLRAHSVLIAARHGRLRISPHFYNNEADIARLKEVLESSLKSK